MGENDFPMSPEVADMLLGLDVGTRGIRQRVEDRYLTRASDNAIEEAKQNLERTYVPPSQIPGGHLQRPDVKERIVVPPKISLK